MLLCRFDQGRDLLFGFRIHDQIGNAAKLRVLDRVHLFLRVAMAVPQPDFAVGVDLDGLQRTFESRREIPA